MKKKHVEWVHHIEDIMVFCSSCSVEMVLESSLNDHNGIFVCPVCGVHLLLEIGYDFLPK